MTSNAPPDLLTELDYANSRDSTQCRGTFETYCGTTYITRDSDDYRGIMMPARESVRCRANDRVWPVMIGQSDTP
jgi:hypothetical protein